MFIIHFLSVGGRFAVGLPAECLPEASLLFVVLRLAYGVKRVLVADQKAPSVHIFPRAHMRFFLPLRGKGLSDVKISEVRISFLPQKFSFTALAS